MGRRRRGEKGKPWFRAEKNAWYITAGGKLVALKRRDGSLVKGEDNEEEAMTVWHQLMVLKDAPISGDANPLSVVFEHFLLHLQKYAKPKTCSDYNDIFTSFDATFPTVLVKDLKPVHLDQWWDAKHPGWGGGMRRLAAKAIMAALNWASSAKSKLIQSNPLRGMDMPRSRSRTEEALIDQKDHEKMVQAAPEDLRDVLIALRHTGTRPGMVAKVEAKHFYPDLGIWKIEDNKMYYKTEEAMVIPLSPFMVEMSKRLAQRYPEGPLFRTAKGTPWNAQKLASRIYWYKKKLKVNVIAYGYRHTLATDLLVAGEPDTLVAAVLGQKGTQTLHRNYSHVMSKVQNLRDIVTKHSESLDARTKKAKAPGKNRTRT